ncbi:MAG: hypothetical protein RLY85_137 [Bacteroidota bacterium]
MQFKKPVMVFNTGIQLNVPINDLPSTFGSSGCNLVKTAGDLFLFPKGTGRKYRLVESNGGHHWQREDSTYFTGYNFGCLNFHSDGHFYSFGGQGLWQSNGLLRKYNPISHEWDVMPQNMELAWSAITNGNTHLYALDDVAGMLMVYYAGIQGNHVLKDRRDPINPPGLYRLNMRTGDWRMIGTMQDTSFSIMAQTPWGVLVDFRNVIDLNANRYFKLKEAKNLEILAMVGLPTKQRLPWVSYFVDSVFYLGDLNQKLDSIIIKPEDLVDTGRPVFQDIPGENWSFPLDIASFLSGAGLLLLVGMIFRRSQKSVSEMVNAELQQNVKPHAVIENKQAVADIPEKTPTDEKAVTFRSSRILDLLEEKERSLLEFIYYYSEEERLTTIEEINKVIGVANRSMEVQKRMRSDLIGSINQKMGLITKDKKPVIDKQRSEFDKRSFEYFIRTEHMELVARVLGNK